MTAHLASPAIQEVLHELDCERSSLLAKLKAVIAHEINNPLAAVVHCLDSLRNEEQVSLRGKQLLERAHQATERIRSLVTDFAQLAALDCEQLGYGSLHEMVRISTRMLAPRLLGASWVENGISESLMIEAPKARLIRGLFALAGHMLDQADLQGGGGIRFSSTELESSRLCLRVEWISPNRWSHQACQNAYDLSLAAHYFQLLGSPLQAVEGGYEILLTAYQGGGTHEF